MLNRLTTLAKGVIAEKFGGKVWAYAAVAVEGTFGIGINKGKGAGATGATQDEVRTTVTPNHHIIDSVRIEITGNE